MIVTVTLNAAIDRTLFVPNFQLGQRHRASVGSTSAGGKGINVARAARLLGVPVVCTGLAGGRNGTLLVEELTNEGILNDFVRIRGESRTSTAVLDPTSNVYTEINEWGPEVADDELEVLREKLAYLAQGADYVVFAGSLPRDVDPGIYAELIRDGNRRGLMTVLDSEGEALRLGIEAEPYLVAPNLREAEALVGHEFVDEADLSTGLDEVAELGARNVIITLDTGCYSLFREERTEEVRLRARAPRLEPASTVGAGDTLLAGFIAARMGDRSYEDAVRSAVAASAASVLEAGPGRFDAREAARLTTHVTLDRLEPVRQDA
jgi:1-phosphofructokinase family hexose kinase